MPLFPKPLSRIVEPLLKPVLKSRGLAGTALLTDWRRIAGDALASHCWPEKLSFPHGRKTGGTLTVAVENGFATELQHMQPVILERCNVYFGYEAVTRLAISHSMTRPKPPVPSFTPPGTLPPEAAAQAEKIADPGLKAALQSLAKTLEGK